MHLKRRFLSAMSLPRKTIKKNIKTRDTWRRRATNHRLNCIKQIENILKYELYTNDYRL